jgi:hypothetical protein
MVRVCVCVCVCVRMFVCIDNSYPLHTITHTHTHIYSGTGATCLREGANPNFGVTNYDTIFYAWLTTLTVISLEGWVDVVYFTWETSSYWSTLYFLALILVVAFFVKELITGVIYSGYMQCVDEEEAKMQQLKAKHMLLRHRERTGTFHQDARQFLAEHDVEMRVEEVVTASRTSSSHSSQIDKRRVGGAISGNLRDASIDVEGKASSSKSQLTVANNGHVVKPGQSTGYGEYPQLPTGILSKWEFETWHPRGHIRWVK